MDVKEAVKAAKNYVSDLLMEEGLTNLGLEEVEYEENEHAWYVTLGFSRPWNTSLNTLTALTGDKAARRNYRVVKVRDLDAQVISFKRRDSMD